MGSRSATSRISAKKIAVIGAGPSGLAAAKFLKAEKYFTKVDVYEQRSNVGGLWEYTREDGGDGMFAVPQTDPHIGLEKPVWARRGRNNKMPIFLSPIYERLETNIPRSLMRYAELDFDDDIQLFPKHHEVQRYLEKYAADVRDLVNFNTQVLKATCSRVTSFADTTVEPAKWTLTTIHLLTGSRKEQEYDALVVGSGHFSVPYIPNIPGIDGWHEAHPGSISHSKYYRLPEAYSGKNVIVVGNSASGLDISSQIVKYCKTPLLLSSKTESYLAAGFKSSTDIDNVPEITKFDVPAHAIHFKDGRVVRNVDVILFCTGYLYSLPFLEKLTPNPINDGTRVEYTYQHLFFRPEPTLCFLTLPQKIIPFPLAEVQAAVVARVLSGRLALPSQEEMEIWETRHIAEHGRAGEFHTLPFPKDANYINALYDWAACAEPREGLENDGKGKMGKRWGEWEFWARERFPAIRRAFVEKGEERKHVRTLEEVRFDFEQWRRNEKHSDVDGKSTDWEEGIADEKGSL